MLQVVFSFARARSRIVLHTISAILAVLPVVAGMAGFAALAVMASCASAPSGAPALAASKAATASDYFPLEVGWKWAYELERDGQHLLAVYAVSDRVPDAAIVQAGDERIAYAVTPLGIAQKDGPVVGDFILKNPVARDTTWNVAAGTAKITAVDKIVTGPSGDYRNCVVVEILRRDPTRLTRTTFAPGVGPVEIEVEVESQGRFVTTTHAILRGTTKPGQDPLALVN
jgi:hypothetical protein